MASRSTANPSQAFYSPLLNRSNNVPCRFDRKRKSWIILWKDVELIFPNARYATLGQDTVPFLMDEDFKDILPLRIEPCPGQVLSVIANDAPPQQAPAPPAPTFSSPAYGSIVPSTSTWPAPASSLESPSTVLEPAQNALPPSVDLAISSIGSTHPRPESSFISNLSLTMSNPSSFSSINIGTRTGSTTTTQTLYQSVTATATGSGRMLGSQDDSVSIIRQEGATTAHNAGQPSIDFQARIKEYTKHLRESEWHEAPSPRLFIVLPATSPSKEYRLYWLCEDFSSGELIPHLTHEDGIKLQSPDLFFGAYGEALLLGLYLFKATKDTTTDDEQRYDEGISVLRGDLCCSRKQVESSIDSMITLLQSQLSSHAVSPGPTHNTREPFPQFKDGLYGIRSFLSERKFPSRMSKERHHGLYRLVGEEGNIQWVCSSHFHQQHANDLDPSWINVALGDHGTYDDQRGLIISRVQSKDAVNDLSSIYDADLRGLGCISEFSLHLGWETSDLDLDELCSAVARFNLSSVVLTSLGFRQDQSGIAKPIKHILKCDRMQSFGLGSLCEDRKLLDSLLLAKRSSKLKSLRLALNAHGWDSQAVKKNVDMVINDLPTLEELDVRWDELEQVPHLESLLRSFAVGVCQAHKVTMRGETQEVTLTAEDFMHQQSPSPLLWTRIH